MNTKFTLFIAFIAASIFMLSCKEQEGIGWQYADLGSLNYTLTLSSEELELLPSDILSCKASNDIEGYSQTRDLEFNKSVNSKEKSIVIQLRDPNFGANFENLTMNKTHTFQYDFTVAFTETYPHTEKDLSVLLEFNMDSIDDGGKFEIIEVLFEGKKLNILESISYHVPLSGKVKCTAALN